MAVIPLLAMVRKDLLLFFSDRRAVIMSFIVPIAIASFFGSIFSGGSSQRSRAGGPLQHVDREARGVQDLRIGADAALIRAVDGDAQAGQIAAEALEHVLDLLPDLPAGKLAIAATKLGWRAAQRGGSRPAGAGLGDCRVQRQGRRLQVRRRR